MVSRREWLVRVGAGVALGYAASKTGLRDVVFGSGEETSHNSTVSDNHEVFDHSFYGEIPPDPGWKRGKYVPLGPNLEIGSPDLYAKMKKTFLKKVEQGKAPQKGQVTLRKQHFGVPVQGQREEALLAYANSAMVFLRDRIQGIQVIPDSFIPVTQGEDYSNSSEPHAFVGPSYYGIHTAIVEEPGRKPQNVFLHGKHSVNSFLNVNIQGGKLQEGWYAFIGMGPASLFGPFSEVIPLTTTPISNQYIERTGNHNLGLLADETVVEAMSHLLATELLSERGFPNVDETASRLLEMMLQRNTKYQHVPKAIEWMRHNGGPQAGFDCYMNEGSERFMTRLGVRI